MDVTSADHGNELLLSLRDNGIRSYSQESSRKACYVIVKSSYIPPSSIGRGVSLTGGVTSCGVNLEVENRVLLSTFMTRKIRVGLVQPAVGASAARLKLNIHMVNLGARGYVFCVIPTWLSDIYDSLDDSMLQGLLGDSPSKCIFLIEDV
jgi:hypothetical protein